MFTDAVLRDRLLEDGHPAEDVDRAFEIVRRSSSGSSTSNAGDVALGYFGAMLAIVGIPAAMLFAGLDANLALFVGLGAGAATLFGWVLTNDSNRRGLAKGFAWALVTVVVLPVVGVVGLWGYCLVAGSA